MVWVPASTGSHLGGSWVEVDENGKAASGSAFHTNTVKIYAAHRIRPQQTGPPPTWSGVDVSRAVSDFAARL